MPVEDIAHRDALADAAGALKAALRPRKKRPRTSGSDSGAAEMTPAEEVKLLHILE